MARYRIGIDLGGTNIAAALVGEDYSIVRRLSVPTDLPRDPASVCDSMAHLCRRLCEEEGIALSALASVGIGSPGLVQEGVVLRADNIGFFGVPLAEMMQERLGCSVTVHNDANAAALGELLAGMHLSGHTHSGYRRGRRCDHRRQDPPRMQRRGRRDRTSHRDPRRQALRLRS